MIGENGKESNDQTNSKQKSNGDQTNTKQILNYVSQLSGNTRNKGNLLNSVTQQERSYFRQLCFDHYFKRSTTQTLHAYLPLLPAVKTNQPR